MREIKFRGKNVETGEWVEGFYAYKELKDVHVILLETACTTVYDSYLTEIEVHPETVGQYTGLKDKNDVEIYEGDKIKIHQFLFDCNEYENEICGIVEYNEELTCFGIIKCNFHKIHEYIGYDKSDDFESEFIPLNFIYGLHEESYEVIGNIHEEEQHA